MGEILLKLEWLLLQIKILNSAKEDQRNSLTQDEIDKGYTANYSSLKIIAIK